jgi:hypothetical protein
MRALELNVPPLYGPPNIREPLGRHLAEKSGILSLKPLPSRAGVESSKWKQSNPMAGRIHGNQSSGFELMFSCPYCSYNGIADRGWKGVLAAHLDDAGRVRP